MDETLCVLQTTVNTELITATLASSRTPTKNISLNSRQRLCMDVLFKSRTNAEEEIFPALGGEDLESNREHTNVTAR